MILAGSAICNVRRPSAYGTFGCLVRRIGRGDDLYVLSAAHVIALNGYANRGDSILFLESTKSLTGVPFAVYEEFVQFLPAPDATQVCDAAIARVIRPELVSPEIIGIGMPRGIASQALDIDVRLFGAVSQLREARTLSERWSPWIHYDAAAVGDDYSLKFGAQILYGERLANGSWRAATVGGDSGAAVVDADNLLVGLHIGITGDDLPRASICTPIATILDRLQVELVTADNYRGRRLLVNDLDASPAPTSRAVAPANGSSPAPVPVATPAHARTLDQIGEAALEGCGRQIRGLFEPHGIANSVNWQLSRNGLYVDHDLKGSVGKLVTVPRVWNDYHTHLRAAALQHRVPVELILATICTESHGAAGALRLEPGYISDAATPAKISVGLMQTLIATARSVMEGTPQAGNVDRHWLAEPGNSIDAGTRYILAQSRVTDFDPPKVACAYNAGNVYLQDGIHNRWKMRQFPIGTAAHADRYVEFFNDCFVHFADLHGQGRLDEVPACSFYRFVNG